MKNKNENRRGYKKTKVGWIPEEWGCVKLGNISEICRGGSPRPISDYITESDEGFNWLRIGDVHKDSKYINSTHEKIKKEGLKYTTLVNKDELILSNSMSFGRPFVLKVNTCIHDGWLALRKISKCVVTDFLYNILSSSRTQVRFDCIAAGSGVRNLKISTVILLQIPLPPLPEQKAIASVLECWDKAIQKYEEKIEKKKNIKKGLMQKLLSSKQRLPGFDGEWITLRLDEVSTIYDGTHSTPKYVDKGIPFYSVENLTNNNFDTHKFITSTAFEKECKRVVIEEDDILMTRIGNVGTSRHIDWNIRAAFYVSLALLKKKRSISFRFLNYYIAHTEFQKELWKRTIHVAYPIKINLGEIGKCLVQIPPLPEQKAIASILSAADSEIKALEKKLALLRDQKKYLLNNLVTGTIRLPEFCKEVG